MPIAALALMIALAPTSPATARRDAAGSVTAVTRPSQSLGHDRMGRLLRVEHSDGSFERYAYRADGGLIEASNADAEVHLTRDPLGRVTRELTRAEGNESWVDSAYGPDGGRLRVSSSEGHLHHIERDEQGDAKRVELGGARWRVDFERDGLGLERSRSFTGGVNSRWQRDRVGRPTRRKTSFDPGAGSVLPPPLSAARKREPGWVGPSSGQYGAAQYAAGQFSAGQYAAGQYAAGQGADAPAGRQSLDDMHFRWEADDQLRATFNPRHGESTYVHDSRGRLVQGQMPWEEKQVRAMDGVGNIYRQPDGSDRRYGPGGRLLENEGTLYRHDEDGNLIEKEDLLGDITRYRYGAAGRLQAIELPDGRDLRFKYDAFSRRLAKTVVQRPSDEDENERILKETHWRWDGHNALTELDSEEGKTDWLYDPETFNPLAKLKNGAVWGVITEQVGTSTELFSQDGQLVYSTIVDLTGDSRQVVGDVDCPFRWPGQYEDAESGLYYNKNRYYDPAVESYLSADPIGLAGGMRAYGYVEDPLSWIDPLGLSGCGGSGGDKLLPAAARTTTSAQHIFRLLERYSGIGSRLASERLHQIKNAVGRGGADNVLFDLSGGVWDPVTRRWLGSLTEGGARTLR